MKAMNTSWFQDRFNRLPKDRQDRIRELIANYNPEPVFTNHGEERDWSHLNCPMCGGSGHVDDVTLNAEIVRLDAAGGQSEES